MKKIIERIKTDKDFRFDFIIGVWSGLIILGIVIAIIIGIIMVSGKVNKDIEEPAEVSPSPTPVATATAEPDFFEEETPEPEETEEPEEDVIGSTDTVYATTTVNVRQSASTTSASLGKLTAGESIERLESLSNGWSKVSYKGQEAYVKSEYLSSQPVSQATQAPQTNNTIPKSTKAPKASKPTKAPNPTKAPEDETKSEEVTEESDEEQVVQPTEAPQEEVPVSTETPDISEPTDVPPASDNLTN